MIPTWPSCLISPSLALLSSTQWDRYNHGPTFPSGPVTKIKAIIYRNYINLLGEQHQANTRCY